MVSNYKSSFRDGFSHEEDSEEESEDQEEEGEEEGVMEETEEDEPKGEEKVNGEKEMKGYKNKFAEDVKDGPYSQELSQPMVDPPPDSEPIPLSTLDFTNRGFFFSLKKMWMFLDNLFPFSKNSREAERIVYSRFFEKKCKELE